MIRSKFFIAARLLVLSLVFFSCQTKRTNERSFVSVEHTSTGLKVNTNDGYYLFSPYSNHVIETSFIPRGEEYNSRSHAVIEKPNDQLARMINSTDSIFYKTLGIEVHISKDPFQITYYYKNQELVQEGAGYVKTDSTKELHFNITKDELLLGGGERVLGMNRRGKRLRLYNKADYSYQNYSELMNFCIPMVISSRNYAIHFDNPQIGFLDLDSKRNNQLIYETIGGRMTYQVVAGDNWKELTNAYTYLTGRQPMIPRWALGNFSSRFGYHSEKEARQVVNQFKNSNIPLDAIILDLYWFGKDVKGHMGNLAFDLDSFPKPVEMMSDFKKLGVKTILVSEPFILTTSKRWEDASQNKLLAVDSTGEPFTYDFYFGHTGLLDIFKPETKVWFWNIYKDLANDGVAGWWGDLGEPEVHPSKLLHVNGSSDEVHNIYGNEWAKMIYMGYEEFFPNTRPFILMRAGYSGSQHWGMIPWTGDVSRSWGGLQGQMELSLQMGLQGMAYTHSDLGGFAGDTNDPELYRRWLQYGVFQPIFRPHANESVASEAIFKDNYTKQIVKEAIQLRYQLLPYNYTLAFENHVNGNPLMRPLDYSISDTYLWGENILISPIVQAKETKHAVNFPAGSRWYDFYSNASYPGGIIDSVETNDNYIPTFVRGGAFIPSIPTIQSTDNYSLKNLLIKYVYDSTVVTSCDSIYNDDGSNPRAFEEGEYEILYLTSHTATDSLLIEFNTKTGINYSSEAKNLTFIIRNMGKSPSKILMNNKLVTYTWEYTNNTVSIKLNNINKEAKLVIYH